MEKIIDTVNKKAVEDMKEESPYTAFKSEKNLKRAEAMEEKAAASKGEKEESSEDYVSYKEKKTLERASRIIENEK